MTMKAEALHNKIAKALGVGAMAFALAGPSVPVLADGAYSASSVFRTRNLYGQRILNLEKDVNSGNFAALSDTDTSFTLFIAGTTKRDKELKKTEEGLAASFSAAVKAKDAAKAKAAWSEFIKVADLKSEYKPDERGQTDSSGYSPTWGTSKQYIYQR